MTLDVNIIMELISMLISVYCVLLLKGNGLLGENVALLELHSFLLHQS